jgi:hypothetical protein
MEVVEVDMVHLVLIQQPELMVVVVAAVELVHQVRPVEQEILPHQLLLKETMEVVELQ